MLHGYCEILPAPDNLSQDLQLLEAPIPKKYGPFLILQIWKVQVTENISNARTQT